MSQPEILKTDTFSQWNDKINVISVNVGDGEILTTDGTSCVVAINELDSEIGNLDTLTTDATNNLVNAINELNTSLDVAITFEVDLILGMS